jgi:hypothetical protein
MSMSNPSHAGTLIYRCRLCQACEEKVFVPDVADALDSIMITGRSPERGWGAMARRFDYHKCHSGYLGVMDLVGGRRDTSEGD